MPVGKCVMRMALSVLVDLLTARAARTHRVDLQVFRADVDFDLGYFRQDGDGGRARVDAALGLGLGNALHAMPAALELKLLKGRFAGDGKNDLLQSPQLGRAEIEHFVFPAALVGKPLVHIEQLGSEQCRFVAAGARPDFHDQAAAGGRVAGRSQIFQVGFERFLLDQELVQLGLGVLAGLVIFFFLEQGTGRLHVVFERVVAAHGPRDLDQPPLLALQRQELGRVAGIRRVLEHLLQLVVAFELGFKTGIHD